MGTELFSYQILPYSRNSMETESTQEPGKEGKYNKEKVIANFRDHMFRGINRNAVAEWENGHVTSNG